MMKQNFTVREKLNMEDKISKAIDFYMGARFSGDIKAMERAVSTIKDILWENTPQEFKDGYLSLIYEPNTISDFYTASDLEDIALYGEITDDDRIKELQKKVDSSNRLKWYKILETRFNYMMKTIKKLGLGFQEEVIAEIYPDKKKVTSGEK